MVVGCGWPVIVIVIVDRNVGLLLVVRNRLIQVLLQQVNLSLLLFSFLCMLAVFLDWQIAT
jgi:hypothetical protein